MGALGSVMAVLHAWVAGMAAAIAGVLVLLGTLDGLGVMQAKRWLDRLAIALVVLLVIAALIGPAILIGVGPPRDPLHFLYMVVAIAAVPGFRLMAARRRSVRIGGWLAAGGLVTLAALWQLWGTGV